MGTALFGQICCSSAPVAPGATRRTCAHANHAAPCGLAFLGAQCKRDGGCRTANAAVRLFGGTTSLRSAAPTLPTRANRGVSRPAPAVPPRTCECIEHSTLFPGVLAPASITCALRLGDCPLRTDLLLLSAGRFATRRACAHANQSAPATMATAPFEQIRCSSAPVACATRRTCAHANHAAPCGDGNCPLRTDSLLLSAGRLRD